MGPICSKDQVNEDSSSVNALPDKPVAKQPAKEKRRPIRVYGNHFNSDTRTILTLLDIEGGEYEFEEVDIFSG